MTEWEKRKRRLERERRMRGRRQSPRTGLFAFRVYVAAILVGACFVVSIFRTESSEAFCEKVREMIAAELPEEGMRELREWAALFLRERQDALPAFLEKEDVPTEEEKTIFRPDTGDSP